MKRTEILISLMGAALFFCGVFFIIYSSVKGVTLVPGAMTAFIIDIIGGILAIVYFRKDMQKGVAFCLLILGISTILSQSYHILQMADLYMAASSMLYVATGAVLVYYAIVLFLGINSGSLKAIICLGVLAGLELLPVLIEIHNDKSFSYIMENYNGDLVLIIVQVIFIIILTRKELMLPTFLRRLRDNTDHVYDNMGSDPDAFIMREDLGRITDTSDGDGWTHIDNGPVERESVITLNGDESKTELLLQMWRGDERLHLTLRSRNTESYRVIMSIVVEQSVMNDDGSKIRLYGTDGMFADIRVRDREDVRIGYVGTVKKKVKERKAEAQ